jgi:peptidoglycan hydrolase CwlO-like protein
MSEDKEEIIVDAQVAYTLQLLQFDKRIAESEVVIAQLKREKISYIYEQQLLQAKRIDKERKLKTKLQEEIAAET